MLLNNIVEHFFIKKPNNHDEIWTGKLPTKQYVQKAYDFTKVDYDEYFPGFLTKYITHSKVVYHSLSKYSRVNQDLEESIDNIKNKYRSGLTPPSKFISLDSIIQDYRLIKDKHEINAIKKFFLKDQIFVLFFIIFKLPNFSSFIAYI